MNHYGPRQREHDGRWDYTCRNDDRIRPVGYCVPWERIERELGVVSPSRWLENLRPFADRFHDDGHATPEEAIACYGRYQLDHQLVDRELRDQQRRCEVCGEWTTGVAEVGHTQRFILCDAHRTREHVEKLYEPPAEAWTS